MSAILGHGVILPSFFHKESLEKWTEEHLMLMKRRSERLRSGVINVKRPCSKDVEDFRGSGQKNSSENKVAAALEALTDVARMMSWIKAGVLNYKGRGVLRLSAKQEECAWVIIRSWLPKAFGDQLRFHLKDIWEIIPEGPIYRGVALDWGRRNGKSVLACLMAAMRMLAFPRADVTFYVLSQRLIQLQSQEIVDLIEMFTSYDGEKLTYQRKNVNQTVYIINGTMRTLNTCVEGQVTPFPSFLFLGKKVDVCMCVCSLYPVPCRYFAIRRILRGLFPIFYFERP